MSDVCCEICGKPMKVGLKNIDFRGYRDILYFLEANKASVVHDSCRKQAEVDAVANAESEPPVYR